MTAIGPFRRQVLVLAGRCASLVFAVLPVLFDDANRDGGLCLAVRGVCHRRWAVCGVSVFSGRISGVVFIYRLWHAFVVLLLLLLAFGLGGIGDDDQSVNKQHWQQCTALR